MIKNTQTLSIIIVNWNAGKLLQECVTSVLACDQSNFELNKIIIVDNASADGSLELLPIDNRITIIRNSENFGFAHACNQGARITGSDYLLFLNPDTRLFADSLAVPLAFMQRRENQTIGIVGIPLVDDAGKVSRSCARFPKAEHFFYQMLGLSHLYPERFASHMMSEWDHGQSRAVDHVIGAFFLVRHPLFDALHGFDERYFVYLEDIDFSLRAHQKGWSSYYLTDVKAYHKGGGVSAQAKPQRLFYALQSRILYGYKNFGLMMGTLLLYGTLAIEPITRLILAGTQQSKARMQETLQGYKLLYKALPTTLKKI